MAKTVRTKTVEEITIDEGTFILCQRRKKGLRCACFQEEPDPNAICPHCYGVGIDGGYYEPQAAAFINASYEEVQKATVTVGNTTTTSEIHPEDEWNQLTFECNFETHIYYQTLIELDGRYWSVVDVEQVPDEEDDMPLPARWQVTARKLQEFESGYRFMRDHDADILDAHHQSVFVAPEDGGPMLVNLKGMDGANLLYICPKCDAAVTVPGPKSLDDEIEDEIHCDSCGHVWSNEEDLKKRGLE